MADLKHRNFLIHFFSSFVGVFTNHSHTDASQPPEHFDRAYSRKNQIKLLIKWQSRMEVIAIRFGFGPLFNSLNIFLHSSSFCFTLFSKTFQVFFFFVTLYYFGMVNRRCIVYKSPDNVRPEITIAVGPLERMILTLYRHYSNPFN